MQRRNPSSSFSISAFPICCQCIHVSIIHQIYLENGGGGGGLSVMLESQSVSRERWGGGLQGAGGVWTSHVRQEVGVRAQLVNIEPVLLAVCQASPDKCLRSRGECVTECVQKKKSSYLQHSYCSFCGYTSELIQMFRHVSTCHRRAKFFVGSGRQWCLNYCMYMSTTPF